MTKLKLGLAAGFAAMLAFGVTACGQTTTVTEPPAAEVPAEPAAMPEVPPMDTSMPMSTTTSTTTTTTTTTTP